MQRIYDLDTDMKLHPPLVEIPHDDPYCNDLFNRRDFGESLFSLLKSIEDGVVLCVDAPWGEGKTTFSHMWIADLKNRGAQCIYFDAYEHDHSDDPFVPFCAEIIALAGTAFKGIDGIQLLKEDFYAKAKRLGGKLLSTGTRIGVKALTLGIIKDSDIDALDSIRTDLAEASSIAASAVVGKAIEEYAATKNDLDDFRDRLSGLAKAVRDAQNFPLVVIVDELDRCRPDFALALIERIKHLFSAKNVSFLLLVNTRQLENYVKTIYGRDVDAVNYLHKFFTLSTDLPKNKSNIHEESDYSKYVRRLAQHYGIGDRRDLHIFLPLFFQLYGFSLREMERCFASLSLYYAQLQENGLVIEPVVAFLAVLRFRFPALFEKLADSTLSYEELCQRTSVTSIARKDNLQSQTDWFLRMLKYLLLTEDQYNALDDGDEILRLGQGFFRYSINRNQVIPLFCSELTRFMLKDN